MALIMKIPLRKTFKIVKIKPVQIQCVAKFIIHYQAVYDQLYNKIASLTSTSINQANFYWTTCITT